jgi:predicted RNase H-like nuclease (RuvC/YqgF family)
MTETKKEAFRKYLESAGAIDTLTKVLVSLYEEPERPKHATDYIKSTLGAPTPDQFNKVEAENAKLQKDLEAARAEIEELKAKLAHAGELDAHSSKE